MINTFKLNMRLSLSILILLLSVSCSNYSPTSNENKLNNNNNNANKLNGYNSVDSLDNDKCKLLLSSGRRSILRDSTNAEGYYFGSLGFYCAEYYEEALKAINQAIRYDSLNPEYYKVKYRIADKLNKSFGLVDSLSSIIRNNPRKRGFNLLLGRIYIHKHDDFKKGKELLTDELRLSESKNDSTYLEAKLFRGLCYFKLGKLDSAIMDLQVNYNNKSRYKYLCAAYYKLRRNEKAIDCFNKLVAIEPNYVDSYKFLALAHHNKDSSKTCNYYSTYIKKGGKEIDSLTNYCQM